MKLRYAVDPGVTKGFGVAYFDEIGELIWAELVFLSELEFVRDATNVDELAIEIPVVRRTGLQRGRQKDIVDLAVAAGMFIGASWPKTCTRLSPEEWKGQLPKDVCMKRIKERLTDTEKGRIKFPTEKRLAADVWDAIGIGLHVFSPERALVRGKSRE